MEAESHPAQATLHTLHGNSSATGDWVRRRIVGHEILYFALQLSAGLALLLVLLLFPSLPSCPEQAQMREKLNPSQVILPFLALVPQEEMKQKKRKEKKNIAPYVDVLTCLKGSHLHFTHDPLDES